MGKPTGKCLLTLYCFWGECSSEVWGSRILNDLCYTSKDNLVFKLHVFIERDPVTACTWRPEGNFQELVFSFYRAGSRIWNQIMSFCGKHLYPLSHHSHAHCGFFKDTAPGPFMAIFTLKPRTKKPNQTQPLYDCLQLLRLQSCPQHLLRPLSWAGLSTTRIGRQLSVWRRPMILTVLLRFL